MGSGGVTVQPSLLMGWGLQELCTGTSPHPLTFVDESLGRGDQYLLFLRGEEWRLRPKTHLKWGEPSRGDRQWIVCVLNPWKDLTPGGQGSRCWLALLVWPFDCRWKPDDSWTDAPVKVQKAFQKWEVNWRNLSGTTDVGRPCILKTWSLDAWQGQTDSPSSGSPPEDGCWWGASSTFCSTENRELAMKQWLGRMEADSEGPSSLRYWHDKASDFPFLDPGR